MKKVILGTAALLFTLAGLAQAPAVKPTPQAPTTPTSPNANHVDPNANLGEAIQNGNSNKLNVRQAGTQQSVFTSQDDGDGTGDNRAMVIQTGNVNGNIANSGQLNAVEVRQSGSQNQSRSMQEGDRNQAITLQGQEDASSSGNWSRIRQGRAQNAEDNYGMVMQDGMNNRAHLVQVYDNHDAWIQQDGEGNHSEVNQDGATNGSMGHIAFVDQIGDHNKSVVDQDGSMTNEVVVEQHGNNNYGKQVQGASTNGHLATINQGGPNPATNNMVRGNTMWNRLNEVDNLEDFGNPGTDSHGGIAFQTQNGDDNRAQIHQYGAAGTDSNYAEQNQDGTLGRTFIFQNAHGNRSGGGNYARQDQNANSVNSQASLAQNGHEQLSYQIQKDGSDNRILSTQRGRGNQLFTVQDGDNNIAWTAQRGLENKINLQQTGGQSFIVNQNLPQGMLGGVGTPNGNNWADIVQVGPNGNFDNIVDCEFPDQMSPMDPKLPNPLTIDDPCPDCN